MLIAAIALITGALAFYSIGVCVITSYSIHYTKLYENSSTR